MIVVMAHLSLSVFVGLRQVARITVAFVIMIWKRKWLATPSVNVRAWTMRNVEPVLIQRPVHWLFWEVLGWTLQNSMSIILLPRLDAWTLMNSDRIKNLMPTSTSCLMLVLGNRTKSHNRDGWRYNAVCYNMILNTPLQWLRQNINQSLPSQKTPHNSPSRASYGVSIARKLTTYNRAALYIVGLVKN